MTSLILAILVMGFSGIVAQVLLLRDLLITFFGNELSIGIILANWLILEAFGCFFLGKFTERIKRPLEGFVVIQLLFGFFLPLAIFFARNLKSILGIGIGEGVGLIHILVGSFLVLLPVSIAHGALFTFSCKLYSLYSNKKDSALSIGRVYIYETLGTIAGGLVFTYLFIPYFNSLQIALGISFLNFIFCFLLLRYFGAIPLSLSHKIIKGISFVFILLSCLLTFSPLSQKLHWSSLRAQWKGQNLLHYQNSIYGNIAVTKSAEQYTFFSDGIPTVTTPFPDIAFVEEFAHLALLSHPSPKEVLVISGSQCFF